MNGYIQRHRRTLQFLAYMVIAGATLFSSVRTFALADANRIVIDQIKAESVQRRDQICLSNEREHLNDVNQLKGTYLYLVNLSRAEQNTTIARAVLLQLPQTEAKAHTDVAPAFCDEPGVKAEQLYKKTHGKQGSPPIGLPEPDPVVPPRPDRVDAMVRALAKQKPVVK